MSLLRPDILGNGLSQPVDQPQGVRPIDLAEGTENLWFYWLMLGTYCAGAVTTVVTFGVGGLMGVDLE
jgi:hypothetical protein